MPKAKISPYVTSFNAAISACEKGGQWEQALALFQAIPKAKISPNVISYNAAISACEKGERFHQMALATKLPLVHMRMVNEKRR
jgi:pentatricopeptide repeat domain-containing protein 1